MEINNVPLWFSKHFTKWFMQISQSEACNKLATHCFSAFHPMHAATCLGPWEREKMSGWMELILGRKNNHAGKNRTLPESKFFPRWSAGSVQCLNIGALAKIESFLTYQKCCYRFGGAGGWAGIPREHDPEQKGSGFSPLRSSRPLCESVPEQDTKSPRSPRGHVRWLCSHLTERGWGDKTEIIFSPRDQLQYNIPL